MQPATVPLDLPPGFVARQDTTRRVLKTENLDVLFQNARDPVILNKIDFTVPGYSTILADRVFSSTRDVDFIASCECGHYTGNFYLRDLSSEPSICPVCHTEPTLDMESFDGYLNHKSWISCPESIQGGWVSPIVYQNLVNWFKYTNKRTNGPEYHGNYIDDILDPTTPITAELEGIITAKGFGYFYEHFDRLMDYFLNYHPKLSQKKDVNAIKYYIATVRDRIFTRHIPILSSSLHSIVMSEGTSANRRRYVDENCKYVLSAVQNLSYIQFSPTKINAPQEEIEEAAYQALKDMVAYGEDIATNHHQHKKALPRQHIFGTRLHQSFRGVIVPITGYHKMDELHMPWSMMENLLRDAIINRLMNQHGMSASQAYNHQQNCIRIYDEVIHQIMNDLIRENPAFADGGLPVLFNRNPSIRSGSVMLMRITKIKTDVHDRTIGFSSMSTAGPNADYDGDEMNGVLLPELDSVAKYMPLHASYRYTSMNKMEVSDLISLPKIDFIAANTFLGVV